jgi:hypothetical protein
VGTGFRVKGDLGAAAFAKKTRTIGTALFYCRDFAASFDAPY